MKVICRKCKAVMDESDLESVDVREDYGDVCCAKCPNCHTVEYDGDTVFIPVFDAGAIERGFEQGIARIIDHEGEVVCEIGQHWFHFEINADSLTMSAKEYMANHTLGEITQKVADTLNDMGEDDPFTYGDELRYYASLLD